MSHYKQLISDFNELGLDFRINDLNEALEVYIPNDKRWYVFDDIPEALARTMLRELGYGIRGAGKANRTAVSEGWTVLGHKQRYNPIHKYLDELRRTPYTPQLADGHPAPYVIPDFINTHMDNPDTMLPHWQFRWMIGAIAKVYKQERNPILVMGGPQDSGKSTFVRWLCPLPEYFREGAIRPDVKDERIRLSDIWIQEVPELGNSTRRSDVEAFKDFITRKWIVERPAYGKKPMRKPCVCSFYSTVNPDGAGFLIDSTGSSRFIICQVNAIDLDTILVKKPDPLWREALWFYDNQYRAWELSPWEKSRRKEINNQFQMVNALDDILDQLFEIDQTESDWWTATMDIRQTITPFYRIHSDNGFARELARILKSRGLRACRETYVEGQPHRNGWTGIRVRV